MLLPNRNRLVELIEQEQPGFVERFPKFSKEFLGNLVLVNLKLERSGDEVEDEKANLFAIFFPSVWMGVDKTLLTEISKTPEALEAFGTFVCITLPKVMCMILGMQEDAAKDFTFNWILSFLKESLWGTTSLGGILVLKICQTYPEDLPSLLITAFQWHMEDVIQTASMISHFSQKTRSSSSTSFGKKRKRK